MAMWFSGLNFCLGVGAVVLSSLVASKPPFLHGDDNAYKNMAWGAALCTSLLTFFSATKRAEKYREAVRILETEIVRYDGDQSYTINHVVKARDAGAKIIKHV
jgi:hypothetical protein